MRKLFSPFRVVIRFITEISKNKSYPKENCFSDTHFLPLKVTIYLLKVSKFQNESIKSSHCPKYEQKI